MIMIRQSALLPMSCMMSLHGMSADTHSSVACFVMLRMKHVSEQGHLSVPTTGVLI